MGRVAVDAMGGDSAPGAVVAGALEAVRQSPDLEVILFGREDDVRAHLPDGEPPDRVELRHAADVVEMDDSPVESLRRKRDSSISRAIECVAAGDAASMVSAGNTGGVVAAATFKLPRLPHARRAGIAVPFPSRTGVCVLMDVGANIQCKPVHLVQYAVMAGEYARTVFGIEQPRVGVLSVGGEDGKGNALVKSVGAALRSYDGFNCIGNVEGQDVFHGEADVVVCDGFVGNVILKAAEGLGEVFIHGLVEDLRLALGETDGRVSRVLESLGRRVDYAQYGGAPLMGHEGAVFICHGRSNSTAICNAVQKADAFVQNGVQARIAESLSRVASSEAVTASLEAE